MPKLRILNPGYLVHCGLCGEFEPGVVIRKVGDERNHIELCGRCLALALQDVTKQDFPSQYKMWQEVSKLGKEFQRRKLEREH